MTFIESLLAVVLGGDRMERALRRRHAEAAARLRAASRKVDEAEVRLHSFLARKASRQAETPVPKAADGGGQ